MIITVLVKILILLLYINIINTSHFQGGTITYKIVGTYGSAVSIMITQTYRYKWALVYCDNSRILSQSSPNSSTFGDYNANLTCVANCTTSGGYNPVPVRSYCTDYSAAMAISVTQRTDIVNLTNDTYFTIAFVSASWRTLSLPTTGPAGKGWSIACTIDLRTRSDTGKPNTAPVATMISPIYIPVWNRTSLFIPTIDADNDIVRCRFSSAATECADVCPPGSLPNNTIISSNCTLYITGANANDWYSVAIQIEDFADSSSTTPLSSVPVQFLISVYALPTCTLVPLLYGPYNQTGACETLQVGQPYTMILYAENYCYVYGVTIQDIATLSFPVVIKSNLIQNTSSLYSVTLTWTPTASQVGSQILCSIAIDSQNVQSNQYCVAFVVSENGTNACPGTVLQTTDALTTYIDSSTTTTTTITTNITTTTTIASSSLDEWSWLLPFIAVLVSLLLIVCYLCLCCQPPYGLGLLRWIFGGNRSSKPLPNSDEIRQPPGMDMTNRVFGKNFDNVSRIGSSLANSRVATLSNKHFDPFLLTLRNSANEKGKNAVWVYPSPRSNNVNGRDSGLASSRSTTASDKHLNLSSATLRNRTKKKEKNVVWIQPSSRLDNVSRGNSSLSSSRSTIKSYIHLDLPSPKPHNSAGKTGKNVVLVHPPS